MIAAQRKQFEAEEKVVTRMNFIDMDHGILNSESRDTDGRKDNDGINSFRTGIKNYGT